MKSRFWEHLEMKDYICVVVSSTSNPHVFDYFPYSTINFSEEIRDIGVWKLKEFKLKDTTIYMDKL